MFDEVTVERLALDDDHRRRDQLGNGVTDAHDVVERSRSRDVYETMR